MKKRSYRMLIEDILEAMDKIERYIRGLTCETFARNGRGCSYKKS